MNCRQPFFDASMRLEDQIFARKKQPFHILETLFENAEMSPFLTAVLNVQSLSEMARFDWPKWALSRHFFDLSPSPPNSL